MQIGVDALLQILHPEGQARQEELNRTYLVAQPVQVPPNVQLAHPLLKLPQAIQFFAAR